MKYEHKRAFYQAADKYMCWIGLREPNPLGEEYIGRPGHMPKGPEIKAKTADQEGHPLAGLVVDPYARPDAFDSITLYRARENWKPHELPPASRVVPDGWRRGLLLVNGNAIYPDYDLMCVIRDDEKGKMMHTDPADGMNLCGLVTAYINMLLPVPMILHGPEFDPTFNGVGAKESERVLFFGPKNRLDIGHSSMPKNRPH